ncbi:hypothetical protein PGT21_007272 [Puccinia graminis f. sp. tritici]|uniref:Uncharacterized protein n=1 Tax=Puccinia graminis f. sp. tritici TaxID=56615 RepID=A0A5B0MBE1_PUCGR|nr:hypothetical protein PGT21_007272 [Puccinia graminis f. sp. tritici]
MMLIHILGLVSLLASPPVAQASVQSLNERSLAPRHEEFIAEHTKEDPKATGQTATLGEDNHESSAKVLVRRQGTKTEKGNKGNNGTTTTTSNSDSDNNNNNNNNDKDKNKNEGFQGIFIDPGSLGECNNPTIVAGNGMNGRKEKDFTFITLDQVHYQHSEAFNLQIITKAACDKMLNCGVKQNDPTNKKCNDLSTKLGKSLGQKGGAVNWNKAVSDLEFLNLLFNLLPLLLTTDLTLQQ